MADAVARAQVSWKSAPIRRESAARLAQVGPRAVPSHRSRMPGNSPSAAASRGCGGLVGDGMCLWREFTFRQLGAVPSRHGRGTRSHPADGRLAAVVPGCDPRGEAGRRRPGAPPDGDPAVRRPRGLPGRCGAAGALPVTSRSSHALTKAAPCVGESDRNAPCAPAGRPHPGARTWSTRRVVARTTHQLGMSCEASPQISAPALVRTHQCQLTGTCKLFGMPRNRNTAAPPLVVIT